MTKFEHSYVDNIGLTGLNKDKTESFLFDLEWKNGLFKSEKVAGFHFSFKEEGNFIVNSFKNRIIKKKWDTGPYKFKNPPEYDYRKTN